MQSFSSNLHSITAIWKYLESLVKKYYHKDDLIQLFGYYQYSNNYLINIEYNNSSLDTDAFWKILKNIIKVNIVGKILPISEISELYNTEAETLISQFQKLKLLGFEIRNHNTNRQIEEGYLLIPYSFPSLNERSLQRLTEL